MATDSYEIEIKSLLGGKDAADALVDRLQAKEPSCVLLRRERQRNHYFVGGDLRTLAENAGPVLDEEGNRLKDLAPRAKEFSIRTREAVVEFSHPSAEAQKIGGEVFLVVKASVDDTTSENGTARLEISGTSSGSLEELDKIVLDAGFSYQAKWSRERDEYKCGDVTVCIDKNAGYGYLAEFEMIETDVGRAEDAKAHLRSFMEELDVKELPQDRLGRMFAHYNANWPEYYGTEKTFVIE